MTGEFVEGRHYILFWDSTLSSPHRDVENQREISVKLDGLSLWTRTPDLPNTNEEWKPLQLNGIGTEVRTAGEVQNTTAWMYWNY
jgi:hypothetical protein